jgi:hypothetical protein
MSRVRNTACALLTAAALAAPGVTVSAAPPPPLDSTVINDGAVVPAVPAAQQAPAVPLPAGEQADQGSALLRRVLAEARKWTGTLEVPRDSNRTIFGQDYGWDGVAWCAIFVSTISQWAGAKAGVVYPRTASVAAARAWFLKQGRFGRQPEPGDWVIFGPTGADHVELVVKVTATQIETIGGNTNVGPQSHGGADGVYEIRYLRTNPAIDGYGHPLYAAPSGTAGSGHGPLPGPAGLLPVTGGDRDRLAVLACLGAALLAGGTGLRYAWRRRGAHQRRLHVIAACAAILAAAAAAGTLAAALVLAAT